MWIEIYALFGLVYVPISYAALLFGVPPAEDDDDVQRQLFTAGKRICPCQLRVS